jgi:hypothetical protein
MGANYRLARCRFVVATQTLTQRVPRVCTPPAVRRAVKGWASVWHSDGATKARTARVKAIHSEMDSFESRAETFRFQSQEKKRKEEEAAELAALRTVENG